MNNNTASTEKRIGISFTREDLDLMKRMQTRYGINGVTAILRFALKALERQG